MKKIKPIDAICAIRIGIKNSEKRFKNGGCFQLYQILKHLFPKAQPWYDYLNGHLYIKIGNTFYDIDGKHEQKACWKLLTENSMLHAKAHEWDFK